MRDFSRSVHHSHPHGGLKRIGCVKRQLHARSNASSRRRRRTLFLDSNSAWYFCFNTDVDALALSVFSFVVVVVACSPIVLCPLKSVGGVTSRRVHSVEAVVTERWITMTTDRALECAHVTTRRTPNVIHLDDDDDDDDDDSD